MTSFDAAMGKLHAALGPHAEALLAAEVRLQRAQQRLDLVLDISSDATEIKEAQRELGAAKGALVKQLSDLSKNAAAATVTLQEVIDG